MLVGITTILGRIAFLVQNGDNSEVGIIDENQALHCVAYLNSQLASVLDVYFLSKESCTIDVIPNDPDTDKPVWRLVRISAGARPHTGPAIMAS